MDSAINNPPAKPILPAWADWFYGVLTSPFKTISELDSLSDDRESLYTLTTQSFNMVFLSGLLIGCVRIDPSDYFISIFSLLNAITNTMIAWVVFAGVLSTISTMLPGARTIRWKKALVLTGWSFTPIIFFAPLLCFKNALGPMVLLFATVPTWWALFLLFVSFKTALAVSVRKLLILALVLPPMLFFVYIFWMGLSVFVVMSELVSSIRM